jgi:hypothetical protein
MKMQKENWRLASGRILNFPKEMNEYCIVFDDDFKLV